MHIYIYRGVCDQRSNVKCKMKNVKWEPVTPEGIEQSLTLETPRTQSPEKRDD